MLKIIFSRNYSQTLAEIKKLKKRVGILSPTQEILFSEAESRAEDVSIFGDKEVYLVQIKDVDLEQVKNFRWDILVSSEHLFFLIGEGRECEKFFEELAQNKKAEFVKLTEKLISDFPTELVFALQKNDRKNAWKFLLEELSNKDAEPVFGSCCFAYKSLLVYLNNPQKNSAQSGIKDFSWQQAKKAALAGKREKLEVADKYFSLLVAYHKARLGEGDLAKQLERWVLVS